MSLVINKAERDQVRASASGGKVLLLFDTLRLLDQCDALESERDELRTALDEAMKLQSHYAELLNSYDGGERIGFENGAAWIARLRECTELQKQYGRDDS